MPEPRTILARDVEPGMMVETSVNPGNPMLVVYKDIKQRSDLIYLYKVKSEAPLTLSFNASVSVLDRDVTGYRKIIEDEQENSFTYSSPYFTTVGSDPEIFAVDASGTVIPAFTYLPPKGPGVTRFFDGFQAEWTTAPGQCIGYQMDHVRTGLLDVRTAARAVDPTAKLSTASVVDIPSGWLDTIPREHFKLGCAPSENVYGEEPLRPDTPELIPYRSAGWHMHFGFKTQVSEVGWDEKSKIPELSKETIHRTVRLLDQILGVAMVPFGTKYYDPRRREMYGRAGEYRYGRTLEYRVPEVLLGAHPVTWNLFWDLGRQTAWLGLKNLAFIWEADDDEVRCAINEGNTKVAIRILQHNEKILRRILNKCYEEPILTKAALRAIYEGIDSVVARPLDIEGNWWLDRVWLPEVPGHANGTTMRLSTAVFMDKALV